MKIAIIGYGGMGNNHRKYIIPRLNDSDYPEKLEIAGIYDISEERRGSQASSDCTVLTRRKKSGRTKALK